MAQQEMPASYLTRCTTALEVLRPRPVLNTPDHSMGRASSQRSRRSSQEMLASAEHLRGRERRKQPGGPSRVPWPFCFHRRHFAQAHVVSISWPFPPTDSPDS